VWYSDRQGKENSAGGGPSGRVVRVRSKRGPVLTCGGRGTKGKRNRGWGGGYGLPQTTKPLPTETEKGYNFLYTALWETAQDSGGDQKKKKRKKKLVLRVLSKAQLGVEGEDGLSIKNR